MRPSRTDASGRYRTRHEKRHAHLVIRMDRQYALTAILEYSNTPIMACNKPVEPDRIGVVVI